MAADALLFSALHSTRYGSGRRRERLILPQYLAQAGADMRLQGDRQDSAHEILLKWADLESSGKLAKRKETALHGEFLTDVFGNALGFTLFSQNRPQWELQAEFSVPGGEADAALGHFTSDKTAVPRVLIELKGPKTDLDRDRFNGRTAVQQLWDYLIAVPDCPWGIVSNYVSFRLYHRTKTPYACEHFALQELLDLDRFRQFYALFERAGLLSIQRQRARADVLLESTDNRQREVSNELYRDYHENRLSLIDHLRKKPHQKTLDTAIHIAQKLLDRIVFVAFCEDRDLLPPNTIKTACEYLPPFSRVTNPRWQNFLGLFRSIDEGNEQASINAYNGGLFAEDSEVDNLELDDRWTKFFHEVSTYDFRNEVNVDILGHLFEQSIGDLESLRIDNGEPASETKKVAGRRKREGVYYTPAYITRYIVEQTVGATLNVRFNALAEQFGVELNGEPRTKKQIAAYMKFQQARLDTLKSLRICDPACGSGAFLIQAYDYLENVYEEVITALCLRQGDEDQLRFTISDIILAENLYGVDLSGEAVEISRLALWIRTARTGKSLADLSHNIRQGNSVVDDVNVHPRAVDWHAAFPEVFQDGGFDCIIGNPPYVRQELLGPIKPYLEETYKVYHGLADLFVYFYERGLNILKPGGRLSFIVTNKWMRAGFAEPLRKFFSEDVWMESVIDFGHAKQIFVDADVFPGIVAIQKPTDAEPPKTTRVCAIPREQLRIEDLSAQIDRTGFKIPRADLGATAWALEPPAVTTLMAKIRRTGLPLAEFAGTSPYRGILTGLNRAYLVDTATRNALVSADPSCAEVIRRYVRGQDIERWYPDWAGLWMIALKSSANHDWPWSDAGDRAEDVFKRTYPSIHAHLDQFREAAIKRQDQGRFWWELRACSYWSEFEKTKIVYPEITWRTNWTLDTNRTYSNNTVYFLASEDPWILAVANAPVTWWYAWRSAVHGKDEALRFIKEFVRDLPIPAPTEAQRALATDAVKRLMEIHEGLFGARETLLDWLRVEFEVGKPTANLRSPFRMDSDAFVAEVSSTRAKKNRLSAAAVAHLRAEYDRTIEPGRSIMREALELEHRISDAVNRAYRLTQADVTLLWKTAPPRMPIPPSPDK